jgi:murein DD-endopeptidase MepM/ murein hydrolase activator NlpD
MDKKQRKLPTSKKAMEYRVYWLERKLSHMKLNQSREHNRVTIESMPDSPIKELMHLNNEFHRANDQSEGLKKFTEELNRDTLTLNERTERLHEVAAEKLAATDRMNRQSKRVQDRGRKINKESLRTTAISRAINKVGQDTITEAQSRIKEASYLSGLTRAQHAATDTLNQRTHNLNQDTVRATAESLKLNRDLADVTDASRALNDRSSELQSELAELKAALASIGDETRELNASTETGLRRLGETDKAAREITGKAKILVTKGAKQQEETKLLQQASQKLNEVSSAATERSLAIQSETKKLMETSRLAFSDLHGDVREQVANLLSQSKEEIEAHQARQTATLLQIGNGQEQKLTRMIEEALSETEDQLQATNNANEQKIETHFTACENRISTSLEATNSAFLDLKQETDQLTRSTIAQFGQDAKLRFVAFEDRSNQLTKGFIESSQTQLDDFVESAQTRLDSADDILNTLTKRTAVNLDQSESFLEETSKLNEETRIVNDDTRTLNANSESLAERSQAAISNIDNALQEVNAVSRKLFRETRELQDRSQLQIEASERISEETTEINRRSLDIQSDTLQTQGLSQEINNHSLALNDETQRLQLDFVQTQDANNALISELTSLRQQLVDLGEHAQQKLADTENTLQDGKQTFREIELLGDGTRELNQRTNDLLAVAETTIESTQAQNQQTETLLVNAQRMRDDLENLKTDLQDSSHRAKDAASAANAATADIHAVKDTLEAAARHTESISAEALDSVESLKQISQETEVINEEAKAARQELKRAVEESQQINDEFMRGLESVSQRAESTDADTRIVLEETRSLQQEMNNVLQLKGGIDVFQQSVDICQERFNTLAATVTDCQEDINGQSDVIAQYQRRIDAFQQDVNRYRESVSQFENRAQQLEDIVQDINLKIEDIDQNEQERMADQVERMRRLEMDMRQTLSEKQIQLENSINELQGKTEQQLAHLSEELSEELNKQLKVNTEQTDLRLNKTTEAIENLYGDFTQLNRSLLDEIRAMKTQTLAVKEQHALFQQDQRSQLSEQKKRTQNQDIELDTVKHQLENYQRLLETQLDNQPTQQLQQRIKTLENGMRQQQRMIKNYESQQEKPVQDDRVDELKLVVEKMSREMQEVVATNDKLKGSLGNSRSTTETLRQTNHELEFSLQARQEELNNCLQRISRLESREANFEEMIASLKSRDTDTQQTLIQMRAAVKDSTLAMRDTQKTLERLAPAATEKKRDWLSAPKQAAMTSVFAILMTGLTLLGFDEVNASLNKAEPLAALSAQPPAQIQNTKALNRTLGSLKRANDSIAGLGEFAWPVNFGIVDPKAIDYRAHHHGISIKGELGDPVVAINDGKVIFSGNEIRGYGNMIVIQHDDDLVSVYANNQFNYVTEGDKVRRGQLIGDIGQLFNEEAAGLYLEIRHNGEPEDPFNYLRNTESSDLLSAL